MEYRKYYNTPRERIDDDLLLRILDDGEPGGCNYGSVVKVKNQRVGREGCGSARQEVNNPGHTDEEGCRDRSCMSGYALAMVYTPVQEWKDLYNDDDALSHGTIFSELYKPFYHGCSGNCR